MPGMETRAPERTESSRGFSVEPKLQPRTPSSHFRASSTSVLSPSVSWRPLV